MHAWERPTNAQIIARMKTRRDVRLTTSPPKHHAATRYSGTAGDPEDEGYALCADCGTDACAQYQRIQIRIAASRTEPAVQIGSGGGWGANAHPF
jgi:hypothetical protein